MRLPVHEIIGNTLLTFSVGCLFGIGVGCGLYVMAWVLR